MKDRLALLRARHRRIQRANGQPSYLPQEDVLEIRKAIGRGEKLEDIAQRFQVTLTRARKCGSSGDMVNLMMDLKERRSINRTPTATGPCGNAECGKILTFPKHSPRQFCNRTCAAKGRKYPNRKRRSS